MWPFPVDMKKLCYLWQCDTTWSVNPVWVTSLKVAKAVSHFTKTMCETTSKTLWFQGKCCNCKSTFTIGKCNPSLSIRKNGYLGQFDTNKVNPICVTSLKLAKAVRHCNKTMYETAHKTAFGFNASVAIANQPSLVENTTLAVNKNWLA